MTEPVDKAVSVLQQGGVIAYPTEFCFGLGCDPANFQAVQRILEIKRRSVEQGLILIAADTEQVNEFANIEGSPIQQQVLASWPGPVTWTLPARNTTPQWVTGQHSTIAVRVTAHSLSATICTAYGHAIVSTSANRHDQPELLTADHVLLEMGDEVDFIVPASVGGAQQASAIRDGQTGKRLR